MKYINKVQELIGNTPLLKINHIPIKEGVNIFAKLESFNPSGSVKDRIADYMISEAERTGQLKPGGTIVEPTAGNTGISIAFAALNRGYRVIFTVPLKFSREKLIIMKAMGAEIVSTPSVFGMEGATEKAQELIKRIPNSIVLNQFENPNNPLAHYKTTGPEIYEALEGKINYFVAGAGSGGTFSGIAKYLKEQNASIKTYVAEPYGSIMGGGEPGNYEIEGIGNHFIPNTMDMTLADGFIKIADKEAMNMVHELAKKEGLIVGSSSGAAMAGALKIAQKIERGNVVVVFPDRGDRYFTKALYEQL